MTTARPSLLTSDDVYLFNEGRHHRLYEKLGAHIGEANGKSGTYFAVWAPNARHVSVLGDFNGWRAENHPLEPKLSSGIWEAFVPGVGDRTVYKFHIVSNHNGYVVDKADPFGFAHEIAPATASVVANLAYDWRDDAWMGSRRERNSLSAPISVYEVHLGSWARNHDDAYRSLSYQELADRLVPYVKERGFTHVQFLPIMEHPFFGSWGYQTTGYFSPSSRHGSPRDFMALVDRFHQADIGVYLDWVPSHFPNDQHGLSYFDGTHLFEHSDMRQGFHPEWNSYIFNYNRHEVRSFLISSALYWLDKYHVDGIRVDAVASMLYLDYARKAGEWVPNEYGGRENIAAIQFLRELNEAVYSSYPDAQTIAEESTSWPMVSRPTYVGGLGFGMKWDMGWMHDTLEYFRHDPIHRRYHHNQLTFRQMYAYSENFMLPLSHDEVVYGKGSLLGKMPGDEWQRFANLRLLLGCQWTTPGKKLLFMGGELGQPSEWNHDAELEWWRWDQPYHAGVHTWLESLNRLYASDPALHELDCEPGGFQWIDANDSDASVLTYLRRSRSSDDILLVACNFTPVVRYRYRVGVPRPGDWAEVLNSDAKDYGGSGQGNYGLSSTTATPYHGREHSLALTLPPLALLVLKAPRP